MRADRTFAVVLACVLAVGFIAAGLRTAVAEPNDISVGGVWAFKITHAAAGFSVAERVVEVTKRITEVLSTPKFRTNGAVVAVQPLGSAAEILVGDRLVITVIPDDAAGTGVSTVELAHQWAQRLAQGLSKALPDANFHTF
ncbi:MAG TPA: hypothetical protein VJT32_14570 [bacterium]|nr:hypothetical protein [bacterium]